MEFEGHFVLDKSFLNSTSRQGLKEYVGNAVFVVTDDLIWEVCSQGDDHMIDVDLNKIKEIDFIYAYEGASMMNRELENLMATIEIFDQAMTESLRKQLVFERDREILKERGKALKKSFFDKKERKPGLRLGELAMAIIKGLGSSTELEKLANIVGDSQLAIPFLDGIFCLGVPEDKIDDRDAFFCANYRELVESGLDEQWFFYHWLRTLLVYTNDIAFRHPKGTMNAVQEKIDHHRLDMEYVAIGSMCGGLATKEKTMKEFFRVLRPDGELLD